MYPTSLPVTEGLEIVNILKSGDASTKKVQLAYDLWVLQGFAMKTLIGDPAVAIVSMSPAVACDPNCNMLDELEKACVAHQAGTVSMLPIPWGPILQFIVTELGTLIAQHA